jgi:hypothetical protein
MHQRTNVEQYHVECSKILFPRPHIRVDERATHQVAERRLLSKREDGSLDIKLYDFGISVPAKNLGHFSVSQL